MEAGKCNLIIGTSGSGKTVLTKCMVGLLNQTMVIFFQWRKHGIYDG